MNKSLIISWISGCDYPFYRLWLDEYHSFFDEILIYWDIQFRYSFYNAFIQQSLSHIPNIKFIDKVEGSDWRHTATTELIKHATGDWIISIEQDWFCQEWDKLFQLITASMKNYDMFGWWNPTNKPYIHPAFWGIKRGLLEKTSKDFSPHPEINGSDHFAMITYDVEKLGATIDLYDGEVSPNSLFFHLGGVNQNYLNGLQEGFQFHRPEIFKPYNWACGAINTIPQDPRFLDLIINIGNKLKNVKTTGEWNKFFRI